MRNNLAIKQKPRREITQEMGTVRRIDGAAILVDTDEGSIRAKRATSCLVAPVEGDRVLVARVSDEDEGYVLAVLEREEGAGATIVADGDLEVALPRGRFGVNAAEGVDLLSPREVNVTSGAVRVHAIDASVLFDRLSCFGKVLRAEVAKVKLFGESLDTIADRVSQKVKRSYRLVEEGDHVRAGQVDVVAKATLKLHGETALVTAEHLAKIEGDQIHLG